MNPSWFFVGLTIGDRIAPVARPLLNRAVRETYWAAETQIERLRFRAECRRWLRSLPTTGRG